MLHVMRTGDENGQQNLRNSGSKLHLIFDTEIAHWNRSSLWVQPNFLSSLGSVSLGDIWQHSKGQLTALCEMILKFFNFLHYLSPQKKKKKKVRVLPLFYRRRISGLAKVNLVVVLKLETIKPGFKSNPFCPQRQRVLQYSALPQLRFHFYTKGPFHLFIDIRFCSKGIGWIISSFWNPHFLWPAWHHSLWIFFFSTPWPPTLNPLTFCLLFVFTATWDSLVSPFLFLSTCTIKWPRTYSLLLNIMKCNFYFCAESWFSNFHPLTKFRVFTSLLKSLNCFSRHPKCKPQAELFFTPTFFL